MCSKKIIICIKQILIIGMILSFQIILVNNFILKKSEKYKFKVKYENQSQVK